ncbi:MAG: hypothetical protein D4S01_03405, partial [Dehalococcoidia bacterium]
DYIIYPLIVFEGKIFEATFSNNDVSLEQRDYIQLVVDYISGKYKGLFCIDVISKERLLSYLKEIDSDVSLFGKRRIKSNEKNGEKLLKIIETFFLERDAKK